MVIDIVGDDDGYSHEEREDILARMTHAKDNFYRLAQGIGVHPFLEFAGLMGEYIELCRAAHFAGRDFVMRRGALVIEKRHVVFLAEKLSSIFGDSLDVELRRVFVAEFFNEDAVAGVHEIPAAFRRSSPTPKSE